MIPTLSKPSSAAPASLVFITLGALLSVWSGIWFVYLQNNPPAHQVYHYLCYGFLGSGLVLMVIGFTMGPLARSARQAELPPSEPAHEVPKAPTTTAAASDRMY